MRIFVWVPPHHHHHHHKLVVVVGSVVSSSIGVRCRDLVKTVLVHIKRRKTPEVEGVGYY